MIHGDSGPGRPAHGYDELLALHARTKERLAEAEAALAAVGGGAVDALVTGSGGDLEVLTLGEDGDRFFRTLVAAMQEGAASIDAGGTVLYANRRLAELLGVPLERLVGRALADLATDASRPPVQRLLAQAARGPARALFELVAGDGRHVPVTASAAPLVAQRGELCLLVSDLSPQRRAEADVRRERAALAQAQAIGGVGSWEWDLDSGELRWSAEQLRLHGLDVTAVVPSLEEYFALVHPDDRAALQAAVAGHVERRCEYVEEYRYEHPTLGTRTLLIRGDFLEAETDGGRPARLAGTCQDVTDERAVQRERVALETELRNRAWHDPLTGLANRALFTDRVDNALARRARRARRRRALAVAFLDLDDFKSINDTLGHVAGDLLLKGVGERLQACTRPGDTVARFGGDEFALLLEDADGDEAEAVAARIIAELVHPFRILDQDVHARASVGLALFTGTETTEDLLSGADTAMYVAKARGKSHYELFEPKMRDVAVERSGLRNDLEWALSRAELAIHYQPVVDVLTGELRGFEALLRWNHPTRGLLGPGEFIDLAEESGLIVSIGGWVLRHACGQAATWRRTHGRDLTMAVNVSPRQLQDPGLLGEVATALWDSGLDPGGLVLEITESATVEAHEGVIALLADLKELGISLAIDDFGTGYSSLSYLQRFPVDQLKVDRSFVAGVATNPGDLAIVASIVNLAHALGISVVAEGVETVDQLEKLCEMGCDLAQGFNWLRPVDAHAMGSWLALHASPVPGPATGVLRVVLADDREGIRATLRIALDIEDDFSVVGEAASAADTIRLAEHHQPDLIVLDVCMPGMNGIQALPALRRVAPGATIVLLTALDVSAVLADGGDAADGVLDKTRDLGAFVAQLAALVGTAG